MPPPDTSHHQKNAATLAALAGLLVSGGALLALAALVIPDILFIMLVFAGVLGLGALQYVVWGWRLDRFRVDGDEELPDPVNTSTNCVRGLKWGSIVGPVIGVVGAFGINTLAPEWAPPEVGAQPLASGLLGLLAGALTGSLVGSCLDAIHHRDRSSIVLTLALGCLWALVIGFPLLIVFKS